MRKIITLILILSTGAYLWFNLSQKSFILYYHNVGTYKTGLKSVYISQKAFQSQIKYLKRRGYKAVKLEELVKELKNGKPLPKKTFAITFDDGYQNIYENAYPVLDKASYPATVFIAVDEIGKTLAHERTQPEKRLSVNEIKKMSQKWDFESHGVTHRDMDKLTKEGLIKELTLSKKLLEKITKKNPVLVCYPSGKYNNRVQYFAEETGYLAGVTTKTGLIEPGLDLYELPRVEWKEVAASSFKNFWDLKWFYIKVLLGC